MRHSTITLTMDTYGHLFPGQEADAVTQVEATLSQAARRANVPEALKCAAHLQRTQCDSERNDASSDDVTRNLVKEDGLPNSQYFAELDAVMPSATTRCESRPGVIRTLDQGIMSLDAPDENQVENEDSSSRAAQGAAVGEQAAPNDLELAALVDAWPTLPEPIRRGILAMVQAAANR